MKLSIVIHLVSEWDSFHRRPMIEALADSARDVARILCLNPTLTPPLRPYLWGGFVKKWVKGRGVKRMAPNLAVYTPRLFLPSHIGEGKVGRRWRFDLQKKQLLQVLRDLHMDGSRRVSWVFRPSQIEVLGMANEDRVVYECYDEYQVDSRTGETLAGAKRREMDLLNRVDVVFAASRSLCEKRRRWHQNVHFLPNGVNFDLFSTAREDSTPVAPELEGIPHPIVGYIGNLDATVDYDLFRYLADARPEWSFILVGPVDSDASMNGLGQRPNVHLLGRKPYCELPAISKGFDVFVLGCLVNEYLQFSNPLKTWEQLAAGNVIVSADIREMRRLGDLVVIAHDKSEFISSIERVLTRDNRERIEQGVARAQERALDRITNKAVNILKEEFGR